MIDVPVIDPLLKTELKKAKMKTISVTVLFGILLFSIIVSSADGYLKSTTHLLTSVMISTVLSLIVYPFILYFYFGKKIIRKLKNMNKIPENDFVPEPPSNLMVETNNALNGYGPANIGFITTHNIHDD